MPVDHGYRDIASLLGRISSGEIRLPEIQRGYVWKPPQVAKLIDSLYRGYPTGSLLFWQAAAPPKTRAMAVAGAPGTPMVTPPLYLLDGQQRLTSLHRVFNDHEDAQIVFNVETEKFQNQNAATRKDPRWVKVFDIVTAQSVLSLVKRLVAALPNVDEVLIAQRVERVRHIRDLTYEFDILQGFPYEEVAEIFVRVNSRGRTLRATDLALATLSARWPGVLHRMEVAAGRWEAEGYRHLDVSFITRALAAVVLGRGLSAWSYGQLTAATDDQLEAAWAVVVRGLEHLVPLLKNNLGVPVSGLFPSLIALLPPVVFLGSRPDEPLDSETRDGLLYWLLIATIHNRYGGSTDTELGRDIPAARIGVPELLRVLRIDGRVEVADRALVGRSSSSPYHFLSYLVARRRGATDWWYGTEITPHGPGTQALEDHHIHPRKTLRGRYNKQQINDLANLAFISKRANGKIADRSPADYFTDLSEDELRAHLVPLDEELRTANAYLEFLAARRRLLATAMTDLLDSYRPSWLVAAPLAAVTTDPLADAKLDLQLYASDWEAEQKLVAHARCGTDTWRGMISLNELEQALTDIENGTPSEITIAEERVPVTTSGERIEIAIGPFRAHGSLDEWRKVLAKEAEEARALSDCPVLPSVSWTGDLVDFPITSSE